MNPSLERLLNAFDQYRYARLQFMRSLGCPASNRDPLAEFSERLVATLVGGQLAASRVQKGYDVVGPQGERIQVKYLANPPGRWVNEHHLRFTADMDQYALVLFENLDAKAVVIFPQATLSQVGQALGKRHPHQDRTLQLTQHNWQQILASPESFARLGVKIYCPIPPSAPAYE